MHKRKLQKQSDARAEGRRGIQAPAGAGPSQAAFDLWLGQRLHDIYDAVIAEPLPAELRRLIDEVKPVKAQPELV